MCPFKHFRSEAQKAFLGFSKQSTKHNTYKLYIPIYKVPKQMRNSNSLSVSIALCRLELLPRLFAHSSNLLSTLRVVREVFSVQHIILRRQPSICKPAPQSLSIRADISPLFAV